MDIDPTVSRRTLLTAGAGGVGVVALAACSSSSTKSSTSDTQAASTQAPSTQAPATSEASSSAAPASSSSEDSGGSGGKDALISLDDIKVGQGASVKLSNGKPGIVTRLTSSTAVCFSAICTHMGCTVAPKGGELDCPCHGSRYNAKTGAVLQGPAPSPLHKVSVTVQDGKVVEA
jgi:cytochrome b6-f complex iron-sulfur subunit